MIHNMNIPKLPPLLLSKHELFSKGIKPIKFYDEVYPSKIPICNSGTTYNMAQTAEWLDQDYFAVGRWDGTLSIFSYSDSLKKGPLISTAISSPSTEGIQSILSLNDSMFVTSYVNNSMIIWSKVGKNWNELNNFRILSYNSDFGVVNSGKTYNLDNKIFLIIGHSNGFLTIWESAINKYEFRIARTIDLRSPKPTNPWGLNNIRAIQINHTKDGKTFIITGSENGNINLINFSNGDILAAKVYNPDAQRGINSISLFENLLLVGNCSVGNSDKNLWLFEIDSHKVTINYLDSINLRVDDSDPQVFNFCVRWGFYKSGICFFSSTEEGLLWMGGVSNEQKIEIIGYQAITSQLGAAMAFNKEGKLVVVAYNLYEYDTMK